jgi:Collagen triple helix repeat (20 copies)
MRKAGRFIGRHSLALIALFVALGGTTYAASSAPAPNNSVGSSQVINGSLKTVDLSKKARKALKGNRGLRGLKGAIGATGATGATGAQGPKGDTGATGAAGSALAYAEVGPGGTIVSGRVKNIAQTSITSAGTGIFCFSNLGFTPNNVQATRQGASSDPGLANYIMGVAGGCPAGTQVTITIQVFSAGAFSASSNNVMVEFN